MDGWRLAKPNMLWIVALYFLFDFPLNYFDTDITDIFFILFHSKLVMNYIFFLISS